MARKFLGLVFLGAGDASVRKTILLHTLLDEAIGELGALQQGETDPACSQAIEDAVRDFAAALLGREVTLGEKLPYPGDDVPLEAYWDAVTGRERIPVPLPMGCTCSRYALNRVLWCGVHRVTASRECQALNQYARRYRCIKPVGHDGDHQDEEFHTWSGPV